MKNLVSKKDDLLHNFLGIYLLAVLMLWFKTYFSQLSQFDLGVEGVIQQFLLLINPLGSAMLFLGFSFLFRGKRKYTSLVIIYTLMSILLYANIVYYRFFSDFITLPTLSQTQNFGDLGGSVLSLLKPYDILFFVDVFVMFYLRFSRKIKKETNRVGYKKAITIIAFALVVSILNLGLAETNRPQLLTRGFDRNYIVKYLGMYNYTIYDSVETMKASSQRALADSSDITEVINYTKSNYAKPNAKYFGAAKGMNVIYLHLESFQNFLINYKLNGEEVTPFLNSLTKDKNTMYFDNFFHQTGQGKTSDAEFMLENSLFGLPQGSAYITKAQNTYQAAPSILKDYGYTSAVFHGNNGSFWNRNVIYKSFGYDKFFDASYYNTDSLGDMAEYGVLDKPFFEQSQSLLSSLPQPFYTKLITVGNHYPYKMDQNLVTIDKANTGDPSVDNYFQTARYADEAIEQVFNQLKELGLYDNTMIVLYGDHYGISDNHNTAMEQVIGKEITPYESANLQRVPLFIHVPGMQGGTDHTYGGQTDLLPTVLHLLGIDTQKFVQFGSDLLSEEHDEIVPFRNGDFVSPTIYSINEKFYDNKTGLLLDDSQLESAKTIKNEVDHKLYLSDKVVNGDLLRFYTPKGYTPVDPSQYNYSKDENVESN
ncbi:LTA synthase family protein [Lysinibacillus pakistanensis]|uniref:LTA synthase family protein n=1 Tax=Lysinibacillus pakistanensis TaxID=759811 RepID=A0AAX3WTB2_9BACI|nr:LTA synthase family protein [Lysinibacillus pakistanensis]MDM5230486.1 LTA synthase family protein [Lysinibacillus pakistanensis]WHY46069.1 LTA synthase family protein [Lysinibacillus pakistanensis]WHY51080.1 LTA synthase family protein [Lysinibacillus pakistanensis]